MADKSSLESCIVIGAGIAGLLAARKLQEAGVSVTVLDKGRGVGGRMATRRIDPARFDHGAQFFTARDDRFEALVKDWLAAGVARKWSDGFPDESGELQNGHPRYCGAEGMTTIPKFLAIPLEVRTKTRVAAVEPSDGGWQVHTESGAILEAGALVMTAPMPQTLEILRAGGVTLPGDTLKRLSTITYDPCLALMAPLDRATSIPEPGGIQLSGEPVSWVADNFRKGISTNGHGITIHAGPQFSREHWEAPDETIAGTLLDAIGPWLNEQPSKYQLHRWRYSQPVASDPKSYLIADQPAPLVFAGDGFLGSRIEGAALSGLAAAEGLLTRTA